MKGLAQTPDLRHRLVLLNITEGLVNVATFNVQILDVVGHDDPVRVEEHPFGVRVAGVGVVADDGVPQSVGAVYA